MLHIINGRWETHAHDAQLPPEEDWRVWLFLGGRGAGKTRAGAEWVRARALGLWPEGEPAARRIALIGPTLLDVRKVMVEGVSGLLQVHADDERPVYEPSLRRVTWPGGAVAQIFSAEEPDSLRGPAFDTAWLDGLSLLRLSGESATLARTLNAPATQGVLLWDLYAGPTARFDRGNRVQVQLAGGALESVSERALLDGANLAAVRNGDGLWEVLQFQTAELVGTDRYEISRLLRGQAGTEQAMANPVAAGAPFVLLNGAVVGAGLSASDIGREITWRYGPAARDAGDDAFAETVHAFTGAGLRPLSPVHVRGRRTEEGIALSWVRRTRLGGDAWSQVEVPLGEDLEAYEVDVMGPGGTPLRTLASPQPQVLYPSAHVQADFGHHPSQFTVRVSQLSATAGRGTYREETIHV